MAGEREKERRRLVETIDREAHETRGYHGRDGFGRRVMAALARVPRHEFVPVERVTEAYENHPLPIGLGQTISQPYIVALMTELADIDEDSVVLEIGTGSGYQAAVLAELVAWVHSVEVIERLAERARATLSRLGYDNVTVYHGDGNAGMPEHAPYDAVVVTAAAPEVPEALIEQLKVGGRMVIPLERRFGGQELVLLLKGADGEVETRDVLPVAFVPLVGRHG